MTDETITLGGGCFWCLEALFQRLTGVSQVTPGYAGGDTKNPTYREVCAGNTGHAEVIQITFDSETISVGDLLEFFFQAHDPTTLNRQGNDVGTQYRSTIMPLSPEQAVLSRAALEQAAAQFDEPIVTTIEPLETFYPAEAYHHDYYNQNQSVPYCAFVISPKLEKLRDRLIDK